MDAIGELRREHKTVEARLNELKRTGQKASRQRKKLMKQVSEELAVHLDLEEQVVFPLADQDAQAKDSVLKAQEQHGILKNLLKLLGSMEPQEESFMPKIEVLADVFHAHVGEEQRTLFSPIRAALTKQQLEALAERIRQGREALVNPKDYLRSE